MKPSLLLLVAVTAIAGACGGKVVFDQTAEGAGGASSSNVAGPSVVVSSSASSGVTVGETATATSTSTSTGVDCMSLEDQFNAAIAKAQACDACQNAQPCTPVSFSITCGCDVPLNGGSVDAISQAQSIDAAWSVAGCTVPCPAGCPAVQKSNLFCVPGNGGDCSSGTCQLVIPD